MDKLAPRPSRGGGWSILVQDALLPADEEAIGVEVTEEEEGLGAELLTVFGEEEDVVHVEEEG